MNADFENSKPAARLFAVLFGLFTIIESGDYAAAYILLSAGFAIWATWVGTETSDGDMRHSR